MAAICFFIGPIVLLVGIIQMSHGADDGIVWLTIGTFMTVYGIFRFITSGKKNKK